MKKVGITGQAGFLGTHLYNTLGLYADKFLRVPFEDHFFGNPLELAAFVRECDVIIHLAAMNRNGDPEVIFETNIRLVKQLIKAMETTGSTPHIIYSSSTQEGLDNSYGRSKKAGRELLAEWALRNNSIFTGLVIPNIFGPFGNPYYNSVVATFSHQLTHNEIPKIEINGHIRLIYVGELVNIILKAAVDKTNHPNLTVPHTQEIYVAEILELLKSYKGQYFEKGIIPSLKSNFESNLFNTFRSYIVPGKYFPFKLVAHSDTRGTFVEIIRLNSGGQVSFSTTKPGITRGNHFHIRKIERFAVIKGKARIQLRRIGTGNICNFDLSGEEPSFIDMPIWYTHNITNTGSEDLYTIFWINEYYNPDDSDTFLETV